MLKVGTDPSPPFSLTNKPTPPPHRTKEIANTKLNILLLFHRGAQDSLYIIHSCFMEADHAFDFGVVPAILRKGFGSADCDTIYAIHYLSLCTHLADPNPF